MKKNFPPVVCFIHFVATFSIALHKFVINLKNNKQRNIFTSKTEPHRAKFYKIERNAFHFTNMIILFLYFGEATLKFYEAFRASRL